MTAPTANNDKEVPESKLNDYPGSPQTDGPGPNG
jgi:hypothetical protein